MGVADVIPGVSGGTIALIVGIYTDFIEAIKSVNFRWVGPLFSWVLSGFSRERLGAVIEPIRAIHWSFILPLGVGIVLAFGLGSVVVPHLMDTYPVEMAAFFIGLILASVAVPYRQMPSRRAVHILWAVLAAVATYFSVGTKAHPALSWSTEMYDESVSLEDFMREYPSVYNAQELYCPTDAPTDNAALRAAIASDAAQPGAAATLDRLCEAVAAAQGDIAQLDALTEAEHLGRKDDLNPFNNVLVPASTPVQIPQPHLWYIFMSGVIGICAMVLPGISGSFFLLVLGVYHFMLSSALKGFILDLASGSLPVTQGLYVVVFALGCLIGLLSFARLMSHLFKNHPSNTLAVLIGMMIGSLRALWPWKVGDPHTGVMNVLPPPDAALAMPVMAAIVGAVLVLGLSAAGTATRRQRR